ncbi:MAG: hypothetical protein JNM37_14170 [Rhodocyclaceae bacterium]|nr:hypothetical protein [Rhodocyclaceae bacterium]
MRFIELTEKWYADTQPELTMGRSRTHEFTTYPIFVDMRRVLLMRPNGNDGTTLVVGIACDPQSGALVDLSISVTETVDQIRAKYNDISDLLGRAS